MGFWVYMFVTCLLVPAVLIGFGKYFIKKAPAKINPVFGYRTSMSMKNADTWDFAHKYCGKIWYKCGIVMLPLSAVAMLCVFGADKDVVGNACSAVCIIQLLPLLCSIVLTEKALNKTFDKDGNRK